MPHARISLTEPADGTDDKGAERAAAHRHSMPLRSHPRRAVKRGHTDPRLFTR